MEKNKLMAQRRVEILVGLFLIIAVAAFAFLALRVASWNVGSADASYTLNARFDNIGGLKVRAPVKIGGVVVGRVSDITMDDKSWTPLVKMSILNQYKNLPETSSASILTSGLLGEQYVGIRPGFKTEDIDVLGDNDFIEDTKSAIVLEDLISQFLFSQSED